VIGLIRFLPFDDGLADRSGILTGVGLLTAFYAALVGITEANPKTVLAYSSVSQMGLVAAVLGMGLAAAAASPRQPRSTRRTTFSPKARSSSLWGWPPRRARVACGRCCCRRWSSRWASADCR
jgi:hypothetical protein